MDTFLWIGLALFAVGFIINSARAVRSAEQLARYLEHKHPKRFHEIYLDNALRKALLWPLMKGTAVDFIGRFNETFGDMHVAILRSKTKHAVLLMFISLLATFSWAL